MEHMERRTVRGFLNEVQDHGMCGQIPLEIVKAGDH
jgi:hypothetical protein